MVWASKYKKECRCQIIFMPRFVGKPHHFLDPFLSAPKNSSVCFVGNQPSPPKKTKAQTVFKKPFKSQKIPPLFINKKIHPTFIQPISIKPLPAIHPIRPEKIHPNSEASNLGHCWTGVLPIHHQVCPVLWMLSVKSCRPEGLLFFLSRKKNKQTPFTEKQWKTRWWF